MRPNTKTKITVTNERDESVTVATDDHESKLIDFEVGPVEADTQTIKAPYQDGTTYIDSMLEQMEITLEFIIRNDDQKELERIKRRFSRIMNPKAGLCTLEYERIDGVWRLDVVADSTPEFPTGDDNRLPGFQRVLVDFIAPNPYWRDQNQVSRALKSYEGYFKLPFKLPFKLGKQGDRTTLVNDGDVPAPVQIDLQGPVMRPEIRNATTGEFIRINSRITTDEILHIDTTPGQKRVEVYSGDIVRSVFGSLDYANGASFWQLELGENEVEYYADEGTGKAIVAVSWYNKYVGI